MRLALAAVAASSSAAALATGASVGAGDGPQLLIITTPTDFTEAMELVLSSGGACRNFSFTVNNSDLVGGTQQLQGPLMDNRPNIYNKWWTPSNDIEMFLTECCGLSPHGCACHIMDRVGVIPAYPLEQFQYLVAVANFSNRSAESHPSDGRVNVMSPDWRNIAKAMTSTFEQVFNMTDGPEGWGAKCLSGQVSEEVIGKLSDFTGGCTDEAGNFSDFMDAYPDINAFVNCSDGCKQCKTTGLCRDPDEFFAAATDLCDDTTTVRAYLYCFLDANSEFFGTGYGPSGAEFMTIPNLHIKNAGEISVLDFNASGACDKLV